MTTTKATSRKESWPTGKTSVPETSTSGQVFYRTFDAPGRLPLANTVTLDALVEEFERDGEMAKHLRQARQKLAGTLHRDEPETLSSLRLAAGVSQAQLAAQIGTSQPHIARVERGQTDPSTALIVRIAKALNVDEARAFVAIRRQLAILGQ
jgi:DNA-binding XRE family transcriptional regulator